MATAARDPDRPNGDPRDRLVQFCRDVVDFLDKIASGLPDAEMQAEMLAAITEFREDQLLELQRDLGAPDTVALRPAGLTGSQLQFKLRTTDRSIELAGNAPPRSDAAADSEANDDAEQDREARTWKNWKNRVQNALGKIRVVLDSLKGLSKWVEALIELVDMVDKTIGDPAGSERKPHDPEHDARGDSLT